MSWIGRDKVQSVVVRDPEPGRYATFEEKLLWIDRTFGRPTVYRASNGWQCGVEMRTSASGAKFEVNSEFNCDTPSAAIDQLIARIRNVLESM